MAKAKKLLGTVEMASTTVMYARRWNVAPYEHEDISITMAVEEGKNALDVLLSLKSIANAAHSSEASECETAPEETEEEGEVDNGIDETEEEGTEDGEEESNEEGSEEESGSEEEQPEEETPEVGEEDTEESDDGVEEEQPVSEARKYKKNNPAPGAKKKTSTRGAPVNYDRNVEIHKTKFADLVSEYHPKWKKDEVKAGRAKTVSARLNGTPFLDKDGDIVESFRTSVVNMMKPGKPAAAPAPAKKPVAGNVPATSKKTVSSPSKKVAKK